MSGIAGAAGAVGNARTGSQLLQRARQETKANKQAARTKHAAVDGQLAGRPSGSGHPPTDGVEGARPPQTARPTFAVGTEHGPSPAMTAAASGVRASGAATDADPAAGKATEKAAGRQLTPAQQAEKERLKEKIADVESRIEAFNQESAAAYRHEERLNDEAIQRYLDRRSGRRPSDAVGLAPARRGLAAGLNALQEQLKGSAD